MRDFIYKNFFVICAVIATAAVNYYKIDSVDQRVANIEEQLGIGRIKEYTQYKIGIYGTNQVNSIH